MESGFPGQHTTTTTVTSTATTHHHNIRLDPLYVRSIPGGLKVVQIVLNLFGFICVALSDYGASRRGEYFNVIAIIGLWFSGIMLALYLFHVVEKFYRIPWIKVELIFSSILAALYLLASILAIEYASYSGAFTIASICGFCATAAYAYDAWLKYNVMRSGASPQGHQDNTKHVSAVTSPAY